MIMARKKKLPGNLLDDSAATLRLVDSLLDELREGEELVAVEARRVSHILGELALRPTGLTALPGILLRAYSEIMGALETLRQSRGVLERATVERVQRTHQKLQEVSSATEMAATDMLDGLDRALLLIDRLDELDGQADSGAASAVRGELRDEVFRLISCLQFQDITAQQLRYASSVLEEIEERLRAIATLFDVSMTDLHLDDPAPTVGGANFDPGASMLDSEGRQAMADEIFTVLEAKG
jgi:hypothetical protein